MDKITLFTFFFCVFLLLGAIAGMTGAPGHAIYFVLMAIVIQNIEAKHGREERQRERENRAEMEN